MTRKITLAALLLASVSSPAFTAEPGSWTCDKPATFHPHVKASIREISTKARRAVFEHMKRWDAAEVRRQCEAFANGEPYEISCLNGRRDWEAIAASFPSEVNQLSATNRREYTLKLQEEGNGYDDAIAYCASVGALQEGFSLQILKD